MGGGLRISVMVFCSFVKVIFDQAEILCSGNKICGLMGSCCMYCIVLCKLRYHVMVT